jgi:cyclopropane fatty-acyl-phospholipid synthase-like methyltransferase
MEGDVAAFYDEFVDRQTRVGVNRRHQAILGWLKRFGLRPDSRVLEIGCGVGMLTRLLAEALPQGSVLGTDLSPRSIASAEERLASFENVELLAGDALEVEIEERFDVVVLPDVIEHIPLESHGALFERVASWVKPEGFVLAHYPNPHHLEWFHVHRPERLQIIDQPIHADVLMRNVYEHGLYLDYFERYSIWIREGDYIVAVLRPSAGVGEFTKLPPPRPSLRARAKGFRRRLSRRIARA